jgi:hypothetical protein
MLAETLLQKATENGIIPVRLEDDVVRFRVGHLYANSTSALRELYANELRACHTARNEYGANPRIQVTVNVPERTIAIHGIDSLGITEENFLNVLSVLGENDNQSGSEVGQFGWGVQSYTSVASNILFETFARETGEKFSMLGINGDHFSKVSQPALWTTGTRVTLYVKDELNVEWLANQFHNICAYADIPTFLNIMNESQLSSESSSIDDACGVQINNPDLGHGLWSGERIKVEDDDYQLAAVLTSSSSAKPGIDIRLLRLPIKAPGLTLPFDHCVLNVKDERKYKPTADRERLTDDAIKRLQEKVDSKLKEILSKFLDIMSFDDFRRKQCRSIYYTAYWATNASATENSIWRLYTPSETTKRLSKLLNLGIWVKDWSERRSSWATPKMVNKRSRLGDVVEESGNIFLVDSLDKNLQDLLRNRYEDAATVKPDDWDSPAETIQKLTEQGIRTDAFSEAQDIKNSLSPIARSPHQRVNLNEDSYEVILHTSRVREFKQHGMTYSILAEESLARKLSWTRKGELAEDTVFVPQIERYLSLFGEVPTDRHLARIDKLPKSFRDGRTTLERFIEARMGHEVATSKGKRTFKSLLQESDLTILVYEDERIAGHYDGDGLLIPLSGNDTFELCLFLRAHDKVYVVCLVPSEAEFMRATGKYRSDYGYNEHSFDTNDNLRVNIVYHVSLAIKDERMRQLFLAAATKNELIDKLAHLRDFALNNFGKPAKPKAAPIARKDSEEKSG